MNSDRIFFWCINQFWCIFEPHFFWDYYFFQQAGSMAGGTLWARSQWNHVWVSPQLLKNSFTASGLQDSNHSLRFLTPNTAFLVRIVQIHTNFGWLKWLHKIFYLGSIVAFFFHFSSLEKSVNSEHCKKLSAVEMNLFLHHIQFRIFPSHFPSIF
jgi:hypothetical protein